MNGKVLSKDTKKRIVDMIVDLLKVSFFLRPIVRGVASAGLGWLDAKGDKVIPDNVDIHINEGINAGFDGDKELASQHFGTASNILVDLPNMDETSEQKVFVNGILTIISMGEYWVKRRSE